VVALSGRELVQTRVAQRAVDGRVNDPAGIENVGGSTRTLPRPADGSYPVETARSRRLCARWRSQVAERDHRPQATQRRENGAGFRTFPTRRPRPFVAYGPDAVARRRCVATRRDGKPCRAWALWDDPGQRCLVHAGRGHRGPTPRWSFAPFVRAAYVPCNCPAYGFPHKPAGGRCAWPYKPPDGVHTSVAASHEDEKSRK
jgi:hypothetical protein